MLLLWFVVVCSFPLTVVCSRSTEYQFQDLQGHEFRVVALRHFPFMDFVRDSDQPGTTVTPLDAMDTRFIDVFTELLNFT